MTSHPRETDLLTICFHASKTKKIPFFKTFTSVADSKLELFDFVPYFLTLISSISCQSARSSSKATEKKTGRIKRIKQISERKKHIKVQAALSTFKWKIYNEHYGNIYVGVRLFLREVNEGASQ